MGCHMSHLIPPTCVGYVGSCCLIYWWGDNPRDAKFSPHAPWGLGRGLDSHKITRKRTVEVESAAEVPFSKRSGEQRS